MGAVTTPTSAESKALEILDRRTILAGSVGLSIAALLTVVRLAIRFFHRKRLAWDDGFAIIAMLLLVVSGVTGKLYHSLTSSSTIPQHSRVVIFYISAVVFDLVIWTSRLSILATILRFGFYTRYLQVSAGLFGVSMIVLFAQVFWVCEPQDRRTHWKSEVHPQCMLGDSIGITQVTTDAFADIVLVVTPFMILRHLRSDSAKGERLRLSVSFAVGGLTTVVSIVHAYYVLNDDLASIIVGVVEMSVSVIICNFTVLATALHRVIRTTCLTRPAPPTRVQEQSIKFAAVGPGQHMASSETNIGITFSGQDSEFDSNDTEIQTQNDSTTEKQQAQLIPATEV